MELKNAVNLLNQVKRAGVKHPLADELVRELRTYIKQAKMEKKSFLDSLHMSDEYAKQVFAYWATAALVKLKASGVQSLQNINLIEPNIGEIANDFGKRALRGKASGGQSVRSLRKRNQEVSEPASNHGKIIEKLWEKLGSSFKQEVKEATAKFEAIYAGTTESPVSALGHASNWALALNGHNNYDRDFNKKDPGTKTYAYNKVINSTPTSGSLKENVMAGISEGIIKTLTMKNRWIKTQAEKDSGKQLSMDQEIGTDGNKTLGDLVADPRLRDRIEWNEEARDRLAFLFGNGDFDNDPDTKEYARELLVEFDIFTLDQTKGEDLKRMFLNGEFDDDESVRNKVEDLLIGEYWLEDHLEINDDTESAADQIEEAVNQVAESAVNTAQLPVDLELKKNLQELMALDISIENLKGLALKLQMKDFHWLFDSHLYLEGDWVHSVRNFDGPAMALLQHTIKTHQQPMIAVGLKYLLRPSTFSDVGAGSKMIKIKEFADACMDQKLLKSTLGEQSVSLWYMLCALTASPFSFKAGGKNQYLESGITQWQGRISSQEFWNILCTHATVMSVDESKQVVQKLVDITCPIVPKVIQTKLKKNITKFVSLCIKEGKAINPKSGVPFGVNGANKAKSNSQGSSRGMAAMQKFFGVLASELIRYRFYLDLKVDEAEKSSNPAIPKTLGNDDCDNNVREIMGRIPTDIVTSVKTKMYEDLLAPEWIEEVAEALEKRVALKLNNRKQVSKTTKELFDKLGITEQDEIYKAYVTL